MFRTFFKLLFGTVAFGAIHGLLLTPVLLAIKTRFVFEHYEVVNEDGTITYYHRNLRCCGSCNLVAVNTCDKMGFARLPFEEAQPAARAFGMEALKFCFKSR